MSFIVVAYYTEGTMYEDYVPILKESLEKFNIPYDIQAVPNLGSWLENTSYKPTFIKEMLQKHHHDIVYTDIDSVFMQYPTLFDEMPLGTIIGVHLYDRSLYLPFRKREEVLSGTIFFKSHPKALEIVEQWEEECTIYIREWDQRTLQRVLNGQFYPLPANYCVIFDVMADVENPVIVHSQASRKVRKKKGRLT